MKQELTSERCRTTFSRPQRRRACSGPSARSLVEFGYLEFRMRPFSRPSVAKQRGSYSISKLATLSRSIGRTLTRTPSTPLRFTSQARAAPRV
jgi:hypothetical protein